MRKTTNKFSPEIRKRAIRLVLDDEHEYPLRLLPASSEAR